MTVCIVYSIQDDYMIMRLAPLSISISARGGYSVWSGLAVARTKITGASY